MIKDLEKRRKYMNEWTKNRRAAFFADKKCMNCGRTKWLLLFGMKIRNPETGKSKYTNVYTCSKENQKKMLKECPDHKILCRHCAYTGYSYRRKLIIRKNSRRMKRAVIKEKERDLVIQKVREEGFGFLLAGNTLIKNERQEKLGRQHDAPDGRKRATARGRAAGAQRKRVVAKKVQVPRKQRRSHA